MNTTVNYEHTLHAEILTVSTRVRAERDSSISPAERQPEGIAAGNE